MITYFILMFPPIDLYQSARHGDIINNASHGQNARRGVPGRTESEIAEAHGVKENVSVLQSNFPPP